MSAGSPDNFGKETPKFVSLSRLNITGELNEYTPICVLEEILETAGKKFEQKEDEDLSNYSERLRDIIIQTEFPTIPIKPKERNDRHWRTLSKYVNPEKGLRWDKKSLQRSFKFLSQFDNSEIIDQLLQDFEYGRQEPKAIGKINCCILYAACRLYFIKTNIGTNSRDMEYRVREHLVDPDMIQYDIRELLKINLYERSTLFRILHVLDELPDQKKS